MTPRLISLLSSVGALLASAPQAVAGGAVGLELGPGAVQVGSGQHQVRPELGAWAEIGLGERWALGIEGHASRRLEGQAPASFDERWARAAVCAAAAVGDGPARLLLAAGPAATWRSTSITLSSDGDLAGEIAAARREYGARYRIGLGVEVGPRWRVDALAGGSTRGRSVDHDLMLRGGLRW